MNESPSKILIVDDDRHIVLATQIKLEAAGYEVHCALDGREGWDLAHACLPDLIILDVRMPKLDGISLLAALKSQPETESIPVIMLSACEPERRRAQDLGARYFFDKPYDTRTLTIAIESALEQSRRDRLGPVEYCI